MTQVPPLLSSLRDQHDSAQYQDYLRMIAWQCRAAFERIRCGIAQRAGLDVDILNSAISVDELHPAETIAFLPSIALPDQYERVRAGPFGIDIAKEIAELKGAPRSIGPTLRYVLEDVLVSQGTIYGRGRRKLFNYELGLDRGELPWADYDEAALRSSFLGCHFFGHWLRDDCATHLLAEHSGTPVSMPTPPWPDRASYLALFGQSCVELGRVHVRRLVLFDDISQNAHKAQRFRSLRARVANIRVPSADGRIVYLMRGSGGKQRTLLNEAGIAEALMRRGAVIVQAETLSVPQLITELLGARIIISVEGSQISHALFTLSDEGGILVIQPPDRFFNSHMDWAHALGMRYGVVVGEQRELGFYLPIDDLLRTIDLVDVKLP